MKLIDTLIEEDSCEEERTEEGYLVFHVSKIY
jgi:hypothetical protein